MKSSVLENIVVNMISIAFIVEHLICTYSNEALCWNVCDICEASWNNNRSITSVFMTRVSHICVSCVVYYTWLMKDNSDFLERCIVCVCTCITIAITCEALLSIFFYRFVAFIKFNKRWFIFHNNIICASTCGYTSILNLSYFPFFVNYIPHKLTYNCINAIALQWTISNFPNALLTKQALSK